VSSTSENFLESSEDEGGVREGLGVGEDSGEGFSSSGWSSDGDG
jgi:hypothetical protein